jgi:oxaloacetate decarboxylase (Na+ extruding) subunit gamma
MSLILDGLKLMATGMGCVFAFLLIMIGLMWLVGKIVAPFSHMLEAPAPVASKRNVKKTSGDDDKSLIAAVIAAVHQHRNR